MDHKLPPYATTGQRIWFYGFRVICGLIFFFLIAPILTIIPLSFNAEDFFTFTPGMLAFDPEAYSLKHYEDFFTNPDWQQALRNSVLIAPVATILSVTLGTLAAIGLSQSHVPFKGAIMAILISPMIVPLIISAAGMYFFYSRIGLQGTYWGVVLAHAALGIPFVIITVTATLVGFDRSLTRAAASWAPIPVTTFFKIQMPLILPGVISGGLFAFITSFDEVVVVIFVGSAGQQTLPWQMFTGLREQISPTILAVATILVAISIALLTVVELLAAPVGAAARDEPGLNVLGRDQRGREAQRVVEPGTDRLVAPMITPCAMQSATTACAIFSATGSLVAGRHQFGPAEQPLAAHMPDHACLSWSAFEVGRSAARPSRWCSPAGLFLDDRHVLERRRRPRGAAAEGRDVAEVVHRIGVVLEHLEHLLGRHHAGDRGIARGHALGHRHEIGLDPVMLIAEPFAGAAHAADDLVDMQQDVVFAADLLHARPIALGRGDDAAAGGHRLKAQRAHGVGPFAQDHLLDLRRRPIRRSSPSPTCARYSRQCGTRRNPARRGRIARCARPGRRPTSRRWSSRDSRGRGRGSCISCRRSALCAIWRTILNAFSFASEPELV
jgi:putative spermidine/putrescine transport system permease protein